MPLPLHARAFLKSLPQMAGADAVAAALKPLLSRAAAVSRLRRAALVGGLHRLSAVGLRGRISGWAFCKTLRRRIRA